jgi:hypothetical protein
MGIWDNSGMSGKGEERRDETRRKRTILKDRDQTTVLGGKSAREVVNGQVRLEDEIDVVLETDDGIITTTDPQDQRYPHVAGKDYQGNLVSAGNLHRCMEKGCNRMVSNLSGAEYKPGYWRCTDHYKRYNLRQFIKALLSPFYTFKEED